MVNVTNSLVALLIERDNPERDKLAADIAAQTQDLSIQKAFGQIEIQELEEDENSLIQGPCFNMTHSELPHDDLLIFQENGSWVAYREQSMVATHKDFDELIKEAKQWMAERYWEEDRSVFGGNLSNMQAIDPLFHHFWVPENVEIKEPWFKTKWGSWYCHVRVYTGEDEDDYEDLKLSIRDHEPSRTDMGRVNKYALVSKRWEPEEVADALSDIEDWLARKADLASFGANY